MYIASKALTETQKWYVAIELESLTVAWAMEKFHHFLYGTHFILEMDPKLLEAILSKSLNQETPWLQRILIQTFPYYFTVCHIPGPINKLADCLSRLGNQNDNIKSTKGQEWYFKSTPYSNIRRWWANLIEAHNYKQMA